MLDVLTVPVLNDNYVWVIHDGHYAVVIDPGETEPVLNALGEHQLTLAAILLTHHHADHIGGVPGLLAGTSVPVYGPAKENIATVTHPVGEGAVVDIAALSLRLDVLDIPGHTRGHIAYIAKNEQWLFCGDTLFCGGCGRLFEGTPKQMVASLNKLLELPGATKIFCGHEYTSSNLAFALTVDADNPALKKRYELVSELRAKGHATVPSTIDVERMTNPFLRCLEPSIIKSLLQKNHQMPVEAVSAFSALREWKNNVK